MKLELPLALGMLAIGCWLFFFSQAGPDLGGSQQPILPPPRVAPVQAAAYEQVPPELDISSPASPSQPANSQPPTAMLVEQLKHGDSQAARFLRQASENLKNGSALQANSRLHINMFEQSLRANGQYWQSGQGRGKSRFDFEVGSGDQNIHLSQICDGRFFFLETRFGDKSELSFVDLERVARATSPRTPFAGSANHWLGIGGIGSLLLQLEASFNFAPPERQMLGSVPVWNLKGTWKPDSLEKILHEYVDSKWLTPKTVWNRLPPQIPHSVELLLGNDELLPLFPYRIVFYQFQQDADDTAESAAAVTLEMYEVSQVGQLDDQLFQVDKTDRTHKDITHRFASRLDDFRKQADAGATLAEPVQRK